MPNIIGKLIAQQSAQNGKQSPGGLLGMLGIDPEKITTELYASIAALQKRLDEIDTQLFNIRESLTILVTREK